MPPVNSPDDQLDAVPGVVITPSKCDVMPGYARLNKQEEEEVPGEIRRTNKQSSVNGKETEQTRSLYNQ